MFLHRKSLLKFTYSEYLLCHVNLKSKALTLGIRDVLLFTSFFGYGILIRKFNLTFICAHICIIPIKMQKGKMYTPILSPCVIWFPLFHINLSDHIAFNPCRLLSCRVLHNTAQCVSLHHGKNLKMGHIQISKPVYSFDER